MKEVFIKAFVLLCLTSCAGTVSKTKEVRLKIVETSDIHGNFYPYDFKTGADHAGSLARVHAFLQEKRKVYGDRLIYMDNGDILQGQPPAYYYNFTDTVHTHLAAEMLNYMQCNVGNMGNHDIEAGHAVYDRWIGECGFPVLGANIIDNKTGKPYLKPYVVLKREGVKIAVLGMITPLIPNWLSENLWAGLHFEDMVSCAEKWMKVIREKEKPDVVVGLFHSGLNSVGSGTLLEDASEEIAKKIPGFDILMIGHDHRKCCKKVENIQGDSVWIVNPANNGLVVADVDVKLTMKGRKVVGKEISGRLSEVEAYGVSQEFMERFSPQFEAVKAFVSRKIGKFENGITSEDAYFGSSAFIDFIHSLQLKLGEADISFCAPLSFRMRIEKGDVRVCDMFDLYRYENRLYTIRMTGKEIKNYLEMSYALWTNRMTSPNDHIMLLDDTKEDNQRSGFKNFSFNFDSAAGIRYTVDVTKPEGEKVTILGMSGGAPFDMDKEYKVAVNSYRGNGGGELLTKGAGIPAGELKSRILKATGKDLRYYMMRYIEQYGTVNPQPMNHWKFVPEDWAEPAIARDRRLLFGH